MVGNSPEASLDHIVTKERAVSPGRGGPPHPAWAWTGEGRWKRYGACSTRLRSRGKL